MKKTTPSILTTAILAVAGIALSATSAQAQNANYDQAAGDIVLFAQALGGSQTLMLNIGTGQSFRDTTANIFDLKNIGTELQAISNTTPFVGSWHANPDLYWGIAGVRDTGSQPGGVTGDPSRTIYASRSRANTGVNAFVEGTANSTAWGTPLLIADGTMTTGSGNIQQMTLRMETVATTDRLLEGTGTSLVDDQNPFLGLNPGTSFATFTGSVQNLGTSRFNASTWGDLAGVTAESALDLYRILADNTGATEPAVTLRRGVFQGSFVLDSDGDVSFIVNATPVPEPTTMGATLALGLVAAGMRRRRRVTA